MSGRTKTLAGGAARLSASKSATVTDEEYLGEQQKSLNFS